MKIASIIAAAAVSSLLAFGATAASAQDGMFSGMKDPGFDKLFAMDNTPMAGERGQVEEKPMHGRSMHRMHHHMKMHHHHHMMMKKQHHMMMHNHMGNHKMKPM